MARQNVLLLIAALALLATVASATDAPAAGTTEKPKPTLPTFATVPSAAEGPTSDNEEIGTVVDGDDDGAAGAPTPGESDVSEPAGVGGPVSESTFGTAEDPNSGAAAAVSAGGVVVLVAVTAAALF